MASVQSAKVLIEINNWFYTSSGSFKRLLRKTENANSRYCLPNVVFTLPQTNTNHCTRHKCTIQSSSLSITTNNIACNHACWHWGMWSCSQVASHSLPLDCVIAKPGKKNRKRRERTGGNKCLLRTCAWLLQDGALNLTATSGRGWVGTGCIKEPHFPNALE